MVYNNDPQSTRTIGELIVIMVIVKALRNLGRGEDGDLAAAYAHFHKMVDQHEAVVNNAILGAMNELQQNSKKVHADIRTIVDASGRTEFSVSSLAAKMDAISRSFNSTSDQVPKGRYKGAKK